MEDIKKILIQLMEGQDEIKTKVGNIEKDVADIKYKVTAIFEQTADLTEFKTEITQSLEEIKNDVEFLTHKENQTEKTLFNLERKVLPGKYK